MWDQLGNFKKISIIGLPLKHTNVLTIKKLKKSDMNIFHFGIGQTPVL